MASTSLLPMLPVHLLPTIGVSQVSDGHWVPKLQQNGQNVPIAGDSYDTEFEAIHAAELAWESLVAEAQGVDL